MFLLLYRSRHSIIFPQSQPQQKGGREAFPVSTPLSSSLHMLMRIPATVSQQDAYWKRYLHEGALGTAGD